MAMSIKQRKIHSKRMKLLWKESIFKNRDNSYRDTFDKKKVWKRNISNTVKKLWKKGIYTQKRNIKIGLAYLKALLYQELGDVLWYISNLAYELGLDLNETAEENLKKLFSRKKRGKIKGEGDNR